MTPENQESPAEEQTETPGAEQAEAHDDQEGGPRVCAQHQSDGTIKLYIEGMENGPEPVQVDSEERACKAFLGMLRELPSGQNEEAGMMEGYGAPPAPAGGQPGGANA